MDRQTVSILPKKYALMRGKYFCNNVLSFLTRNFITLKGITFDLNTLLGNPQHLRNFSLSKNEEEMKTSTKNVQKDPGNPPCSPCRTQIQFPALTSIKTITLAYRSLKQFAHSCPKPLEHPHRETHHRHRTILLCIDDKAFIQDYLPIRYYVFLAV